MADYTPAAGHAVALTLAGTYAPPAGGAVHLVLGPAGQAVRAVAWHVLAADARAVAWHVLAQQRRETAWHVLSWPPIRPGLYCRVAAPWAPARRLRPEPLALPHGDAPPRRREPTHPWRDAPPRQRETADAWNELAAQHRDTRAPWADTVERWAAATRADWNRPVPRRADARGPWAAGEPLASDRRARYRVPARHSPPLLSHLRPLDPLAGTWRERYRRPPAQRLGWDIPWNQSRRLRWEERWHKADATVWRWLHHGRLPDGAYLPLPGDAAHLALQCALLDWPGYAVWLFLREQPCLLPVVKRRTWFLMNAVSVVRAADDVPVPVLALGLTSDLDSWAWGASLTLPDREALELVAPLAGAPVEVRITVNGYSWSVWIDAYAEQRRLGESGYTVTGRSPSAALAAPYAVGRSYVETAARTAVQLAEAELDGSGWSLDWSRAVDWLVPPGAWAYDRLTPLEAVGRLAASIGAHVLTDRAAPVLRVMPRYPVSPWHWMRAVPDAVVSDNLLRALSLRWEERPSYHGVYVSGQDQGVLVRVTREGTAGEPSAGLVVDPLITAVAAARERGRNLLAAGGRRAAVTVELPLLAAPSPPGLLAPGQLVEVHDGREVWRGLVTACRIEAARPWVGQTVELERRY